MKWERRFCGRLSAQMVQAIVAWGLLFSGGALAEEGEQRTAGETDLQQQVVQLRALVEKLQSRLDDLEKRSNAAAAPAPVSTPETVKQAAVVREPAVPVTAPETVPSENAVSALLHQTSVNLLFDGYYGHNFNNPIGRVNLLRPYDVSSNAFSLSQAALVVERAADPANGRRFGLRVDFQYGQATASLQGNPANEPRPEVYRNIFQAYGTYVAPIGSGLTVDFGKFAGSLGLEGTYTKDQMNYSRAYWFSFLPYYHMGLRANYKINKNIALNYWAVNGTQQTEPLNGFKDQFVGVSIQGAKVSGNVNYYLGQEHPDVIIYANGGAPAGLPNEQGTPFEPIVNPLRGKLHMFDTYWTWSLLPKLQLAVEADYVVQRESIHSPPLHSDGGSLYAQYQFTPKFSMTGRTEYMSERGGLFTGMTQAIKESTLTAKYSPANGFVLFGEWRRDWSNHPYFYTSTLGALKKEQNTATLGVVWWIGSKQGAW